MRRVDEIYEAVINAVLEEVELPDDWMKVRTEDCVDARHMLVYHLSRKGLTRNQIEAKTGFSKTSVRQYLNSYSERVKYHRMMAYWSARIGRKIGDM